MKLVIWDKAPSINHYWLARKGSFARRLSPEGKAFKDAARIFFAHQHPGFPPLSHDISMTIHFVFADKRRRDIDNYMKPLLDALQGCLYHDDRQVKHLADVRIFSGAPKSLVFLEWFKYFDEGIPPHIEALFDIDDIGARVAKLGDAAVKTTTAG